MLKYVNDARSHERKTGNMKCHFMTLIQYICFKKTGVWDHLVNKTTVINFDFLQLICLPILAVRYRYPLSVNAFFTHLENVISCLLLFPYKAKYFVFPRVSHKINCKLR